MAITDAARIAADLARHPKAIRARHNRRLGRIVVSLAAASN
jgi:hypothetical protein